MKMKWMAAALLLLAASGCLAQEMDEKNDPALHAIIYTPHRVGIAKAQQRDDLRSVWTVTPFIGENYQRTNKFLGVFVELYGDRGVANTGSGGLMFRVDGQRVLSPSILAHSHRQPSCYLGRCSVTWTIAPKTPAEESALVQFVQAVANGHAVYATLFPGNSAGGERFIALLTDQQQLTFGDALQYYQSLAPHKGPNQGTSAE